MGIDLNTILIWTPLIGVLVAICALIYQIRRSRFSLSVDLILKFEDRFNSEHFKTIRSAAAKSILKNDFIDAEDVFDFFETIGMLTHGRALNKEYVWNTFFYWIHRYWLVANEYIIKKRREDPTIWEEFKFLHEEMTKIERCKRRISDSALLLSKESINEFLNEEVNSV